MRLARSVVWVYLVGFVGKDALLSEFDKVVCGETGGNSEENEDHGAETNGNSGEIAFVFGTVCEGSAIAVAAVVAVGRFLDSFTDALRIVHRNGNESGEPKNGIRRIKGEESVGIGETLSSRPHRGHNEIDNGWSAEEAQGEKVPRCTPRLSSFGHYGQSDTSSDEYQEHLDYMCHHLKFLDIALRYPHLEDVCCTSAVLSRSDWGSENSSVRGFREKVNRESTIFLSLALEVADPWRQRGNEMSQICQGAMRASIGLNARKCLMNVMDGS